MTDYKRLLQLYMAFIGEQEGTDYLYLVRPNWISSDEWAELERVSIASAFIELMSKEKVQCVD